ncbi:hypothetical protein BTM29_11960 [Companilactobacillus allii]|uniref:Uncharacterized protein n=1 Tax=Companilactobacillus allii TaxID=1847728 RepID=A0A1P8Q5T1_9LACO|nr:hypothetical protein BTM29_11960 [Companilactobacillus allii]
MTKTNRLSQIFAWVIFWIENILIISIPVVTVLHPKDVTGIPDNISKVIFSFGFLGVIIILQIITYFSIRNIDSYKWNINLLILGLIHNPLYLIPSIICMVNNRPI